MGPYPQKGQNCEAIHFNSVHLWKLYIGGRRRFIRNLLIYCIKLVFRQKMEFWQICEILPIVMGLMGVCGLLYFLLLIVTGKLCPREEGTCAISRTRIWCYNVHERYQVDSPKLGWQRFTRHLRAVFQAAATRWIAYFGATRMEVVHKKEKANGNSTTCNHTFSF